jgi:ribosomal protein S11
MARLESIDSDLALRQNELEDAASAWFRLKRDRERDEATAFMAAVGPVEQRRQEAKLAACHIGAAEEGAWEGKKAVVRVLETRANIGMAILKSQGRS